MKKLFLTAAVAAYMANPMTTAQADGWVIDFEDLTNIGDGDINHGRIMDQEYVNQILGAPAGVGVEIGVRNFKAERKGGHQAAVAFDTSFRQRHDKDLIGPFRHSSSTSKHDDKHDPGNILIIQNRKSGTCDGETCSKPDDEGTKPAGQFIFEFTAPVTLTSLDFFDIEHNEVKKKNGKKNAGDSEPTQGLRFYSDVAGANQIGPVIATPITGDHRWEQVTFNVSGVMRLVVDMAGSGGIDRLTGDATGSGESNPNTDPGSIQNVPETGSLILLTTALLGLGIMARRKKSLGEAVA